MDDKPLKDSDKILVQVGTTERPMGWQTEPAQIGGHPAEQVVSFGHAPWMIVRGQVTVALKNSKISRARVLDSNGMPVKDVPLKDSAGGKTFEFPPDALYVVLQSGPG
jgi:hypothetical protein